MISDPRDGGTSRSGQRTRPRILLVAPPIVATFIEQDRQILSDEFDVTLFSFCSWRQLAALSRHIGHADLVLIWFAGRHAVPAVPLARLRHIPLVIVIGGFEVAWVPSVKYGVAPGSLREKLNGILLNRASRILTVSHVTNRETLARYPSLADRTVLIPNAIDTGRFTHIPNAIRRGVLHVGRFGRLTIANKGAMLLDVTTALPDLGFRLVGPVVDAAGKRYIESLPGNVTWVGELHGQALVQEYQSASVYFTGSLHESFSLALGEAMACGCVPVVAPSGALPEIVGEAGLVLHDRAVDTAAGAIRRAMTWEDDCRVAARQRVIEHFDLERRRGALTSLLKELLNDRQP